MTIIKSLFLFMLFTIVVSCGKSEEKKDVANASGAKQEIFIKGQIEALYAGATLDRDSFLTERNADSFNDYIQIEHRVFINIGLKQTESEKKEEKEESNEEKETRLKKAQAAGSKNEEDDSQARFSFKRPRNTTDWVYSDGSSNLELFFANKNGKLSLYKVKNKTDKEDSDGHEAEVLHYSVSPDQNHFSLLIKPETSGDYDVLISVKFSKDTKKKLTDVSKKEYQYILGPTKRAVLAKDEKIGLCSVKSSWMEEQIELAFEKWAEYLPEDHLSFEVKRDYPPFSDVNTKCVYILDDFSFTDPDLKTAIGGYVTPAINIPTRQIVDTDMFISTEEWKKILDYSDNGDVDNPTEKGIERFYHTAVHEFGHIFGLAHSFSEDGEHNHISIMNYFGKKEFSEHDVDSIKNLYEDFYE